MFVSTAVAYRQITATNPRSSREQETLNPDEPVGERERVCKVIQKFTTIPALSRGAGVGPVQTVCGVISKDS